MRIYLVQDSNGTGGGMRLFLAGENNKHKIINEMQIHPYILESFYAIEKNKLAIKMLPYYGDFLLDSGAFTFMNSGSHEDWEAYIERYAEFIRANNIQKFFELDIDSIVGYDKVKEFRYRLEKLTNRPCIPVWHRSRGLEEYFRLCDEYSYIAIGGIAIKHIKPVEYKYFPYFINEAHKRKCKLHGLGFTKTTLLEKYHFDSVDSTSWTTGNRFGGVYIFDGKRIIKKKLYDSRMRNVYELAKHNFREWVKFQRYAEAHL